MVNQLVDEWVENISGYYDFTNLTEQDKFVDEIRKVTKEFIDNVNKIDKVEMKGYEYNPTNDMSAMLIGNVKRVSQSFLLWVFLRLFRKCQNSLSEVYIIAAYES